MKEKKPRKIKKHRNLKIWCETEEGIEIVKVPVSYSKDFISKFGTEKIPQRKDLLDWLYEKKSNK